MKLHPVLLPGVLFALPFIASAGIERQVEKTFTVQVGGQLNLHTQGGHLKVNSADTNEVRIVAKLRFKTDDDAEADEIQKKLSLSFDQQGNDVSATAAYPREGVSSRFKNWPPVNVDLEVSVPREFHANLRTSGGHIDVGDLKGNVQARTSGGHIRVGSIEGSVDVHTSGGNISLENAERPVKLNTSGGNIRVGNVNAEAELSTSGGNISIRSATHKLHAKTSGGSIEAAITGKLAGDCELSTSGGNVRLSVDPAAAFELEARTGHGWIEAAQLKLTSMTETRTSRGRLSGAVNGGGPTVKLRSSGGNIRIASN